MLLRHEKGFILVEFIIIFSVLIGIVVLAIMFDEMSYVKNVTQPAAREATRYYAVHISQQGADPAAVLAEARKVAALNVQQFISAKPPWFDPATDVQINTISIGGDEYYRGTVIIHAPVYAPMARKLLGNPTASESSDVQEAWNRPLGHEYQSHYVIDIPGSAVFRREI